jgi:hypothetical protein
LAFFLRSAITPRRSARRLPGAPAATAAQLSFDPIVEARRQWNVHWRRTAAPSMTAVTSIMRVHQILMEALA